MLLQDGLLTVRGEEKLESENRNRTYSERFYGRFDAATSAGGLPGYARSQLCPCVPSYLFLPGGQQLLQQLGVFDGVVGIVVVHQGVHVLG